MFRFVAIAAVAAALSSPAIAEPGLVETASIPLIGSSYGHGPKAVCELPVSLSMPAEPVAAAPEQAMTLSPRMVQSIRIDQAASTR